MLGGGGARAAYQAGVLQALSEELPNLRIPILTGVSAGALNATYLANTRASFAEAVLEMVELWSNIKSSDVITTRGAPLVANALRWGVRLFSGGSDPMPPTRGMVDTDPLREFLVRKLSASPDGRLPGVEANLRAGQVEALAVTSTNYASGQAISWVAGEAAKMWERPLRRSERCAMTVDHIMASASLPLFFPAIKLGEHWHGDGGIRLTAPLSPALHLGANKILVISTRRVPAKSPAADANCSTYPAPAQILGTLMNAIFLDNLDFDAANLVRINELLECAQGELNDLRPVELLVVRPSADLAAIAGEHEFELPGALKFLTRGWGTRQTKTPDSLAMLLFESGYTRQLIELGRTDARAQMDALVAFITS